MKQNATKLRLPFFGSYTEADPVRIAVDQRTARDLPGSDRTVQLQLGDITRGSVLVTIQDRHRKPIAGEFVVGVRDVVPFHIGNGQFYLKVIELRNLAIGDDYGVFEITRKKPKS